MKEKAEIKALIEAAVAAGYEAGLRGVDEKIAEAINLAVTIGAAAGAEVGAAAAIKAVEREKKKYRKQAYDRKYHNTKLLLRNYRRLNEYYRNAVFSTDGAEEADEDFEEIMMNMGRPKDEEIFVESLQKNYLTTRIIMTHVNKMLDCYKVMCERSNRQDDKRRWRVLEGLYISENYTTAEEIAKQEHIDKRTVYRDVDICAADMTALLFGVSGMDSL